MKLVARFRSWLRASLGRARMESDMDRELRFHLKQRTEDLVRGGMSEEEARRQARAEFGGIEARKEECRAALGLRLLDDTRADFRYTLRMLRLSPVFSVVAIVSLALGIGANTAIFTLMEAALWKTAPVKNPEELRLLSWVSGLNPVMDSSWGGRTKTLSSVHSTVFSYIAFQALQRQSRIVRNLFAFKPVGRITAVIDGHAELVTSEMVSGNFYEALGVSIIAGRPIAASDDVRSAGAVAVISDSFWSRRFGRDASAIGKQISLNQMPVTIIGVNSPDFNGMEPGERPDVYFPISAQPAILPNQYSGTNGSLLDDPDTWWLVVMARLRPEVNESQAQAALDVVLQQAVWNSLPDRRKRDRPRIQLLTGSRGLDRLREQLHRPLLVLLSLTSLVLLIACANLANLLLARATARQREISVRLAIGAGRWRIVRQMVTEGLVLAFLGGAAGLLLGYWMRNGIPRLLALSETFQAQFDLVVLFISIGMTFLTGILFSLAPAWQSTRVSVNSALKDGGRTTASLPKVLTGRLLVVFQVSLSLLLLVGAGLFIRTLANLRSANLGFRPERILLFTIDPPRTRYAGDVRKALYLRLEEQIATIPGVQSATLSQDALVANSESTTDFRPANRAPLPGNADMGWINFVGDRFFETMGIPILAGRSLGARDRAGSPLVAVVNQQFVRKFFPDGEAVGKAIINGRKTYKIVGVCGDARFDQVRSAVPPTSYQPFSQAKDLRNMTFEIKTAANEQSIVKSVHKVVHSIDKDLPIFDIRTQAEQIDATLSHERLFAVLTSGFGLLALVLAAVGIYGIMAYGVARRTSEIGIRMALGAQRRQVLLMILREAALLAAVGIVIGIGSAVGMTRYIASMLYGLRPSDPLSLGGAVIVLFAIALLAGWWPARKAAQLDPMATLRHE